MPIYTIQTSDGRRVRMPWSGPGVPTQADVDAFVARAPRGGQRVNAPAEPDPVDTLRNARPSGRPSPTRPPRPTRPAPAPQPQPAAMPRRAQPDDLLNLIRGRNQHTGPGPSEPGWLERQRREARSRAAEAAARGDVDEFVDQTFGPRVGTPEYERIVEARRAELERGFKSGRAWFPEIANPASAGWRFDPATGAYVRDDRDVGGEGDLLRLAGVDPDAARWRSSTGTRDLAMGAGRAAMQGAGMVAGGAQAAAQGVYGAAGQVVDAVQGGGVAAGMEADILRILGPRPAGGAAAAQWDAKAADFRRQNWFDFGQGAVSIPLAGAATLPAMAAGGLAGRGSAAMRLAQGARAALDVDQFAQGVGAGALELVDPSATPEKRLQAVIATALTAGPEAAGRLLARGSLGAEAERAARALEARGLRPEAEAVRRSRGTADAESRLEDARGLMERHDARFGADAADEAGSDALDAAAGRYAEVLRKARPDLPPETIAAQAEASARLEYERGRARLWRGGGAFARDVALEDGTRPRFTSAADWSGYASGRTEFDPEAGDDARGWFDPETDRSGIGAGGDVSTLAHESFHRFRHYLAPEDAAHLVRWATGDRSATRWDRLSGDVLEAAEEKAAEGWERYLATGAAPNPRVRQAFERMRGWMRQIYQGDLPGSALPDDVESVFAAQLSPGRIPDYGRDAVGSGVRTFIRSAMPEWVLDEADPEEVDAMVRELNGPARAAAAADRARRQGLITEAEADAAQNLFDRRMARVLDEWWTSRGGTPDEPTLRDIAGAPYTVDARGAIPGTPYGGRLAQKKAGARVGKNDLPLSARWTPGSMALAPRNPGNSLVSTQNTLVAASDAAGKIRADNRALFPDQASLDAYVKAKADEIEQVVRTQPDLWRAATRFYPNMGQAAIDTAIRLRGRPVPGNPGATYVDARDVDFMMRAYAHQSPQSTVGSNTTLSLSGVILPTETGAALGVGTKASKRPTIEGMADGSDIYTTWENDVPFTSDTVRGAADKVMTFYNNGMYWAIEHLHNNPKYLNPETGKPYEMWDANGDPGPDMPPALRNNPNFANREALRRMSTGDMWHQAWLGPEAGFQTRIGVLEDGKGGFVGANGGWQWVDPTSARRVPVDSPEGHAVWKVVGVKANGAGDGAPTSWDGLNREAKAALGYEPGQGGGPGTIVVHAVSGARDKGGLPVPAYDRQNTLTGMIADEILRRNIPGTQDLDVMGLQAGAWALAKLKHPLPQYHDFNAYDQFIPALVAEAERVQNAVAAGDSLSEIARTGYAGLGKSRRKVSDPILKLIVRDADAEARPTSKEKGVERELSMRNIDGDPDIDSPGPRRRIAGELDTFNQSTAYGQGISGLVAAAQAARGKGPDDAMRSVVRAIFSDLPGLGASLRAAGLEVNVKRAENTAGAYLDPQYGLSTSSSSYLLTVTGGVEDVVAAADAIGVATQQNEMLVFRRASSTEALTGRRGEAGGGHYVPTLTIDIFGIPRLSPAQHRRLTEALAKIKIADPTKRGKKINPFAGNTAAERGGSSRVTASTVYLVEYGGWTPEQARALAQDQNLFDLVEAAVRKVLKLPNSAYNISWSNDVVHRVDSSRWNAGADADAGGPSGAGVDEAVGGEPVARGAGAPDRRGQGGEAEDRGEPVRGAEGDPLHGSDPDGGVPAGGAPDRGPVPGAEAAPDPVSAVRGWVDQRIADRSAAVAADPAAPRLWQRRVRAEGKAAAGDMDDSAASKSGAPGGGIRYIDPRRIIPVHDYYDPAHLAEIAASMSRSGWVGRPLLVAQLSGGRYQALTGSHRTRAARKTKTRVPAVVLPATEISFYEKAPPSGIVAKPSNVPDQALDLYINGVYIGSNPYYDSIVMDEAGYPEAAVLFRAEEYPDDADAMYSEAMSALQERRGARDGGASEPASSDGAVADAGGTGRLLQRRPSPAAPVDPPEGLSQADAPYWARGWWLGIRAAGGSRQAKLHNAGADARAVYDTGVPADAPKGALAAWRSGWADGRTTGGKSDRARWRNLGAEARRASDALLEPYMGRIDVRNTPGRNGREVWGDEADDAVARAASGRGGWWEPRYGREMTEEERTQWIAGFARSRPDPERTAARVLQIEDIVAETVGEPVTYRASSDRSVSTYMVAGDRKIRFSDHQLPDVIDGASVSHGYRAADVELPASWLDPTQPGFTPERLADVLRRSEPDPAAAAVRERSGRILLQRRPSPAAPVERLTEALGPAREILSENPRIKRADFDARIRKSMPDLSDGQRRVLYAYAARWGADRETYSSSALTFEALAERRHRGEVQAAKIPLRDRAIRALFNDQRAAGWARKLLEDATGRKYEGTDRDLESALNRLAVPDQRVIEIIEDGFRGSDGQVEAPGLAAIERSLRSAGLDPAVVEEALRARREIAIAGRKATGGDAPGVSPERAAEQMARLDLWETKLTPEQRSAYDRARADLREWNLRVLQMYEEAGLRPEGWAARIDESNPDYWPLVPRSRAADAAMAELNPERVASPAPQQKRAVGGREYESGWITLRRRAERAVRMGQANRALLPPLEEMSQVPALESVVQDITDEVLEAERRARAAGREPTGAEMDEAARLFDDPDAGGADPVDVMDAQLSGAPVEGQEAVITLYRNGRRRIFRLDPHVWDAIRRGQPTAANPVVQILRGLGQLTRTGTTGILNPVFGLLVNPVLDVAHAVIAYGLNPLRLGRGVRAAWTEGKTGDWYADLWRAAAEAGAFSESGSYRDTLPAEALYDPNTWNPVQRAAQSENPRVRFVADMARTRARQLTKPLRALEQMTRIAMYDQELARLTRAGVPLEEATARAGRAARDLMNFQEAGAAGRFLSSTMGVPYATIPQQAVMSLYRGFKRNPAAFAARALALITAPKLLEYAEYGDDPEYRRLPDYVLDGAYVWRHGGTWYAARFPLELGAVFAGIPRRFAEMRRGRKLPEEAAREQTRQAFRAVVPPSIGTGPGLVAQLSTYLESGAVLDYQFGRIVDYPTQDAAGETPDLARLATQMAGTAAGTFGRNVAQVVAGRTPNPLGRVTPRPGLAAYEPTGQARAWLRRTGAGWGQAKPGRVVDAETGERRDETPEEFSARVARETSAIDAAVLRVVGDPRFRRAAGADQRALLTDVVSRAKRAARSLDPSDPDELLAEEARIAAEDVLDRWESGE